jgi:hypothetical protein
LDAESRRLRRCGFAATLQAEWFGGRRRLVTTGSTGDGRPSEAVACLPRGCELLGFDPLYVACEGRFLAIVPEPDAEHALDALHARPDGAEARRIGRVVAEDPGRVVLRTRVGTHRLLERLSGDQLPRIC